MWGGVGERPYNPCWQGCEEAGTRVRCRWECERAQLPWATVVPLKVKERITRGPSDSMPRNISKNTEGDTRILARRRNKVRRPCHLTPFMSLSRVRLFATPWAVAASPWDSPGKITGVGCHFLLQEIFPRQGLNPHPLHWRVLAGRFFTAQPPGKPHI